jgi:hypothetical protein
MMKVFMPRSAVCIGLLLVGGTWQRAWADEETDLLQKFQQQNQKAALEAKASVEKNVAQALAISAQEPEQALGLLRHARAALFAADGLPRPEKVLLTRKLDDGFRDAKDRLKSKEEQLKALAKAAAVPDAQGDAKLLKKLEAAPYADAGKGKVSVSPILFQPNIVPQVLSSSTTVTPVVSPDRRWVRISFSGAFSIR